MILNRGGGTMNIRKIKPEDKSEVMRMMKFFYCSPAVSTNGSDEIFENNIAGCLSGDSLLNGYVFDDNDFLCGYAMTAESFCTELGKPCVWIEDLFIIPEFRRRGLGRMFLEYIMETYPGYAVRLEVEKANKPACSLYKEFGFKSFPYNEMYLG
jgi:ribosomal protein S18 acetylase RimI-like enzyme